MQQKSKYESVIYLGELQKPQMDLFSQSNNMKLHYDGSIGYSPANS